MAYDPITGAEVEGATAPPPADATYDPAAGDIDRMLDEATRGSPYVGTAPEAPILQPPPAPQPGTPTSALAGAEPSRVAPYTPGASDTPYVVPGGSRVEPYRPTRLPPIAVPSVEDRLRQMYPPPPPIPEGAEPGPIPGSYYVPAEGRPREQPKEPSGVVGSVGKALARGTAGIVDTFAPLAFDALLLTPGLLPAYSLSQAGTISPEFSKTVDAVRDKVRNTISDNVEWVQQKFPLTVPELTNARSAGEVFTGTLERVVEGIPGLAGFLATTAVTGPLAAPIIWGAAGMAHGAERAARESNNDPAATTIGAVTEGFANAFPYHLLTTQAGKGILKGAITFGLTNAGIAAGTQVLDPKTIAAAQSAHDFIDRQDARKIIEAGLTGLVQGATFGAAAGAFGGKKTTDTVLPGTPDPAAEAALRQSLDQGQPPSPPSVAGGPGAPSPAPSAGAPGAALAGAPGAVPDLNSTPQPFSRGDLPAPAAERGLAAPAAPAPPVPGSIDQSLGVTVPVGQPRLPGLPGPRPAPPTGRVSPDALIERARQEQGGVEGIPGATTGPVLDANAPVPPRPGPGGLPVGPEPRPAVTPAREPPPEPVAPVPPGPGGTPIGPEPTPATAVPPGPRPPGVVPGARQPELPGTSPVQPEPPRPPPVSPYRAEPGELPMDTGLPARPPGVAPEARQGELPVIPGAPPQGELPLRQPPSVGEAARLPREQPGLPLGDQLTIPMKLKMPETWREALDDETPGQHLIKSGNDVLAVGSSPEEARAIAEQRAARTPEPAAPLPTVGTEAPATAAAAPAPAPATATPGRGRRAAAEPAAETPGVVAAREGKTVGQVLKEQPARRSRAAKASAEETTTPKETVAEAKAKGEPVGPALVTREQLRKTLGLSTKREVTPKRAENVRVDEPTDKPTAAERAEKPAPAPKRTSRLAEEAVADARAEAARMEGREEGRSGDIPPEEGAPGYKPTTDYQKDIYPRAMREVLNRVKSVADIVRELTSKSRRGRPRTSGFPEFIENELATARDPELRARLEAEYAAQTTAEGRREVTDKIQYYQELHENEVHLREQIAEARDNPDMSRVEQAREAAQRRVEELRKQARDIQKIPEPAGRNVRNRMKEPEAEKPLQDILDRADARHAAGEDGSIPVHDLLDAIANNTALGRLGLNQARTLAGILKRVLPKGTRVITDEMAERFGMTSAAEERAGGYYDPNTDRIVTRSDHGGTNLSHTEVVLHEAIHAATSHYVRFLERAEGLGNKLTPEQERHVSALEAIRREVDRITEGRLGSGEGLDTTAALMYAAKRDYTELPTTIMTDPNVQRALMAAEPSREFVNEMRRLGYGEMTGMFAGMREKINAWTAFKAFVKNVFGIPASADTVFNHSMRALEDVVQAGARYRGQPEILRNIKDARLREAVVPLYDTINAIPLRPEQRDWITSHIGRSGSVVSEFLARSERKAANLGALLRRYAPMFDPEREAAGTPAGTTNAFKDHFDAVEAGARATRVEQARLRPLYTEIAEAMRGFQKLKSPDAKFKNYNEYLSDFTNKVGYNNVNLDFADPTANVHLTSQEQLSRLAEISAEWDRMPQQAKELIGKREEWYKQIGAAERGAELDMIMQRLAPESTQADRDAARAQFMTRTGTRAFLANPDASPLAQSMGERYMRSRNAVKLLADYADYAHVEGSYFRLARYGDFIVSYGERGAPGYGVEFFETKYDAERARGRMAAAGLDPGMVFKKQDYRAMREQINPAVMDALNQELLRRGVDTAEANNVRSIFAELYLKRASEAQARRLGARREGVLGASTDAMRVDNDTYINHSYRLGYLKSAVDMEQSLDRMQARTEYARRNNDAGDPIAMQDIVDQMRLRMASPDNRAGLANGVGNFITNFGFISLLFRPARMPIELAGIHAANQALLGGEHGQAAAARASLRAQNLAGFGAALSGGWKNMVAQMGGKLKEVDWDSSRLVADRMIQNGGSADLINALRARLVDTNLIDVGHARAALEMTNPNWGGLIDRVLGGMAHLDNSIESMGRMVVAHAAAELELARNGGNIRDAVEAAVTHVREVTPNFNSYNSPWLTSTKGPLGALAKPIFQFRNYGLHAYAQYANLMHEALRPATEGQRAVAIKSIVGLMAYHALLGGAAVPIVGEMADFGMGLFDFITGAKQPTNVRRALRQAVAEYTGPTVATAFTQGIPAALGVDVSASLSHNNLMMLPDFRSLKPRDIANTVTGSIFGGVGLDSASSIADGIQQAVRGNVVGGLAKAIPVRVLRDAATAADYAVSGLRDANGRVILPASQISPFDVAAKLAGLNPSSIRNFREGRSTTQDYLAGARDERSKIIDTAIRSGISAVGNMVNSYNHDYPNDRLTYDVLLKAIRDHQQAIATPGTYGVRVPQKSMQGVRDATRYLGL